MPSKIKIPSGVTVIGEGAFYRCTLLEYIEFSKDSKLQTIGKNAFESSSILSIAIPSEVTFIDKNAFCNTPLQIFEIDENSKLVSIDADLFGVSTNCILMVPACLKDCFNK